jgi:hypothetical protein
MMQPEYNGKVKRFFRRFTGRNGWESYASVFDLGNISGIVEDNPLIVVHPGFRNYWPGNRDYMRAFEGYDTYVEQLRESVRNAADDGRTIFVFTPSDYKKETLSALGLRHPDGILLVPTLDNSVEIDSNRLGVSNEEFWEQMSRHVTRAEVCGEWNDFCVRKVISDAKGIKTTIIEDATFPASQ